MARTKFPAVRTHVSVEDPHGRWWRNTRAWLWIGDSLSVGGEWVHGTKFGGLRLKISTTGEETLDVAYGLGRLLHHYWSIHLSRPGGRQLTLPPFRFVAELGLTQASWCIGRDDGSWARNATWKDRLRRNHLTWWRVHWARRTNETVAQVDTDLHLPEGIYPVTVTLERSTWGLDVGPYRRSRTSQHRFGFRLPGPRRTRWASNVESTDGLPHPGRGENSWDCGQDRTYSMWMPVDRPPHDPHDREWVAHALAKILESVYRSRIRHGAGIHDIG